MKSSKLIMPVMALGFAVSLAFANKANVQTAGWINTDDGPQQLQNDPCNSMESTPCRVKFANDPNTIYQVYTSSDLQTVKRNGTEDPYVIVE